MNFLLPDFRVRQRDYLLEIARALTEEFDLEKLLERILNISVEMLSGSAGLIALRTEAGSREEKGGWKVRVSTGLPPAFLRAVDAFLAGIPDSEDAEKIELPEINQRLSELTQAVSMGMLSGVGLPMMARQRVVGLVFIFRAYAGGFSSNDYALLSSFANQAAVAVQNAQLYTQVSRTRDRLNALLDTLSEGILILTPENRVERCNPALSRMLELPAEAIQGRLHEEVIRWAKPPQGLTLEQAEAGGWPLTPHAYLFLEGDLKRGETQPPLPIGVTYAPLISSEGNLLNIIVTVRDNTRHRQAEELKSTFISIISHELKTPVALIKGYVSTLRREDARWDPSIVQDSLAVIEEEADRLTGLIENLLDASRLQAGGMALKRADVNLPDLAERIAKRFRTQTSRHTLVTDFPAQFPVIVADENRLQQVLANLVSNAIKYAPGGEIRISGQVRPDNVIVCVSDEGPGIAQDDIPHIFDRFYRAPEMARNTKGAGLGLFLARSIIEAHGGRIWADNDPGKGARICFLLPISG
ncbi:MAG TPA: ATP-binding protein [Anaerolineaceae bacterium]